MARARRPASAGHAAHHRWGLPAEPTFGNVGRDARQPALYSHAATGGPTHRERHRVRNPGPTPVRRRCATPLAGLAPGGGAAPGCLRTPGGPDRALDDALLCASRQQRSPAVRLAHRVWLGDGRVHRYRPRRDPAQERPGSPTVDEPRLCDRPRRRDADADTDGGRNRRWPAE